MTRPIIIDTDPGQDDALAILLALASPELDVLAITTVAGNVPQPTVTDNSRALLELAGRTDIPVYKGCERPLIRKLYTAEYVHGDSGVDGADLPTPTVAAEPGHAVDLLIEACLDADEPITLCPIGPLTNIGMAIAKEPSITSLIREIVWMGGAFDEPGNTTDLAEFNAYVDPHAAAIVFNAPVPLTVFPLDVTHKALMTPNYVNALETVGTPVAKASAGMIRFYEQYDIEKYRIVGAPMHDPCVIAYLVDPTLFSGEQGPIDIDIVNEATIGNTFFSDRDLPGPRTVMTTVDSDRFFSMLVERVATL
ncbi:MAG: nucleoside hydrolase [Acidimicrobiia bacterium]